MVEHPKWYPPQEEKKSSLKLLNTLTGKKEIFNSIKNNTIKWYICGPTVYDSAHLGHARAYITFDIIRRIFENYLGYNVIYTMNITDVDDKIIKRARQDYLFNKYYLSKKNTLKINELNNDLDESYKLLMKQHNDNINKYNNDLKIDTLTTKQKKDLNEAVKEEGMKIKVLEHEYKMIDEEKEFNNEIDFILTKKKSLLAERIDALHSTEVNDQKIFREHARKYEKEFLLDMKDLNVKEATVLTRVSEYVENVKDMTQKIIDNGYGYVSNGSVYFDTNEYAKKHDYGKLSPANIGKLDVDDVNGEKKHKSDFALWKLSKPGEPFWESQWGKGRPGWHIECSAMSADILKDSLDIHSGGIDLCFPHHDNEIAQCEAFYDSKQWVNYFLHAGHLHIDGHKMSKSLKNFKTIRSMLDLYGPKTVRIMFLQQSWHKRMNYNVGSLDEAQAKSKTLEQFFFAINSIVEKLESSVCDVAQKWNDKDRQMHKDLNVAKDTVREALLDNLDYTKAFATVLDLVGKFNIYKIDNASMKKYLLQEVVEYVHKILISFGVINDPKSAYTSGSSSGSQDNEHVLAIAKAISGWRDQVRQLAKNNKDVPYLKLCDALRDSILPELGIEIDDQEGKSALVKVLSMDDVKREKKRKLTTEIKQILARIKNVDADLAKWELGQMSLEQYIKNKKPGEFSEFNEKGYPTKDKDGKEVTKSILKKFKKFEKKLFKSSNQYNKAIKKDPKLIEGLNAMKKELTEKLEELNKQVEKN